jgi:flagellar biosynthesis GTPase FlhF
MSQKHINNKPTKDEIEEMLRLPTNNVIRMLKINAPSKKERRNSYRKFVRRFHPDKSLNDTRNSSSKFFQKYYPIFKNSINKMNKFNNTNNRKNNSYKAHTQSNSQSQANAHTQSNSQSQANAHTQSNSQSQANAHTQSNSQSHANAQTHKNNKNAREEENTRTYQPPKSNNNSNNKNSEEYTDKEIKFLSESLNRTNKDNFCISYENIYKGNLYIPIINFSIFIDSNVGMGIYTKYQFKQFHELLNDLLRIFNIFKILGFNLSQLLSIKNNSNMLIKQIENQSELELKKYKGLLNYVKSIDSSLKHKTLIDVLEKIIIKINKHTILCIRDLRNKPDFIDDFVGDFIINYRIRECLSIFINFLNYNCDLSKNTINSETLDNLIKNEL